MKMRWLVAVLVLGVWLWWIDQPDRSDLTDLTDRTDQTDFLLFAKGFTIKALLGGGHRLTLHPPFAGTPSKTYWLLPHQTPPPAEAKAENIFRVPLTRLVAFSATHLALLEEIQGLEALAGFADFRYLTDAARVRAEAGLCVDVGSSMEPDLEKLVALRPDAVFIFGDNEGDGGLPDRLKRAGLPAVFIAEYKEEHPLGRAEWLKVFGAFLGGLERAEEAFAAIQRRYEAAATLAAGASVRPQVLSGYAWRGTFWAPGGASYPARLFADAGADYVWANDGQLGALRRDLEEVVAQGRGATFWIRNSSHTSLAQLLDDEPWAKDFRALDAGGVWVSNRRDEGAGNDFWSRGLVRPDLVLEDLVKIFHPDLLGGEPYWHQRLK